MLAHPSPTASRTTDSITRRPYETWCVAHPHCDHTCALRGGRRRPRRPNPPARSFVDAMLRDRLLVSHETLVLAPRGIVRCAQGEDVRRRGRAHRGPMSSAVTTRRCAGVDELQAGVG